MSELPPILFKYMNAEAAWETLFGKTLTFSPPARFNDPFDTNIAVRLEMTEAELRAYYRQSGHGQMNEEEFVTCYSRMPDRLQAMLEQTRDDMMNEVFGVSCFTALRNDPLMWAHYADQHRGVMLGFTTAVEGLAGAEPVRYAMERPIQEKLGDRPDGAEMVKSEIWRYEDEWRLRAWLKMCQVKRVGLTPIYTLQFNPEALRVVLFGCRTPKEFSTAVKFNLGRWGYGHQMDVRHSVLSPHEYKLSEVDVEMPGLW